jgi:hypothetical protein
MPRPSPQRLPLLLIIEYVGQSTEPYADFSPTDDAYLLFPAPATLEQ